MVFAVFFSVPVQAQTTACDILCPPKNHSIPSILSILSIPSKGGWSFARRTSVAWQTRIISPYREQSQIKKTLYKAFAKAFFHVILTVYLFKTQYNRGNAK